MAKKDSLEVALQQQTAQPPATLYNMVAYMKALASMEDVPADLEAAFEAECRTALQDTKDKIDAVHRFMFALAAQAAAANGAAAGYAEVLAAELDREQKRAGRIEGKLERLRMNVMEVGVMRGLYIGEGDKRKPAPIQGNVATFQFDLMPACISSDGYDEARIPDEFKIAKVSGEWPSVEWRKLLAQDKETEYAGGVIGPDQFAVVYQVDRKALLAALKEPCPKCNGFQMQRAVGEPFMEGTAMKSYVEDITCDKCGGTGKRKVPGAKLETGRLKLVVK